MCRKEIDELLVYADTGEDQQVEAALELLRRRRAMALRKKSNLKIRSTVEALESVGQVTDPDT